jgi:hypothetical protein
MDHSKWFNRREGRIDMREYLRRRRWDELCHRRSTLDAAEREELHQLDCIYSEARG